VAVVAVPHTLQDRRMPGGGIQSMTYHCGMQEKVLGQSRICPCIRSRKPHRKLKPANEVSEGDIHSLLKAIKEFDGYPKLKDLGKMSPSLTPLQINVIVRYLERSGAIVIDTEGYIVWARKEQEQLTIGEVAEIGDDLREYIGKNEE
jgi:hypothetical protein